MRIVPWNTIFGGFEVNVLIHAEKDGQAIFDPITISGSIRSV